MARVLLFGRLGDAAGWRERQVQAATIAELRDHLMAEQPALAAAFDRPGVQVALDRALVRGDRPLESGSEVAFLPAMSGG